MEIISISLIKHLRHEPGRHCTSSDIVVFSSARRSQAGRSLMTSGTPKDDPRFSLLENANVQVQERSCWPAGLTLLERGNKSYLMLLTSVWHLAPSCSRRFLMQEIYSAEVCQLLRSSSLASNVGSSGERQIISAQFVFKSSFLIRMTHLRLFMKLFYFSSRGISQDCSKRSDWLRTGRLHFDSWQGH